MLNDCAKSKNQQDVLFKKYELGNQNIFFKNKNNKI